MVKRLLTAVVLLAALACDGTAPTASSTGKRSPFSSNTPLAHQMRSSRSVLPAAAAGAIEQVDPATLTVTGLLTFGQFGAELSNHDDVVVLDGAMFAEHFAGQDVSSNDQVFDVLSGVPTAPLTLQAGAIGHNLATVSNPASDAVVIAGLGVLNLPDNDAIGEGALSVLYRQDQSELGFTIDGADGGTATVSFFRRDGSLIQTLEVPVGDNDGATAFAFRRLGGVQDIAGISIQNNDPGGVGYHDFRIADPRGTSQFVPAGQAATVTVAENGRAVAGLEFPVGTFNEDVIVTVQLLAITPTAPCHAYLLGQIGRCLQITAQTTAGVRAINQQPMTAGLCLSEEVGPRELFKFEDRQGTPAALLQTDAPFLDCTGFQVGSAERIGGLKGLAMGVARSVGRWLSPTPLYAAHGGFGGKILAGDGLSFFTWASPLQISNAGLAVNVGRSGKDAYALNGTFKLQPALTDPFPTQIGFTPATDAVTVSFATNSYTIPGGSFRYSPLLRRWLYAAQTGTGITAMSMDLSTGRFVVAATVPTGGSPPINRPFSLRIGNHTQGMLLKCGTSGACVPQEPAQ